MSERETRGGMQSSGEIIPFVMDVAAKCQAARAAQFSSLPCATCSLDTPGARGCRFYGADGCKHVDALAARAAAEERAAHRRANLARAGIRLAENEPQLQLILRDTIETWYAVRVVKKALASEQKALRFLVLAGDHRTGKTLAMIYACALRSDAVYIPAQKLSKINQDTDAWIQAGLLCINELGREHLGNGYTASNLDEILAERELGGRLTIFGTNLQQRRANPGDANEPAGLAERYGDLFVSRLRPPLGAYVVCHPGPAAAAPIELVRNPRHFTEVERATEVRAEALGSSRGQTTVSRSDGSGGTKAGGEASSGASSTVDHQSRDSQARGAI